jgi:hypothetical protein
MRGGCFWPGGVAQTAGGAAEAAMGLHSQRSNHSHAGPARPTSPGSAPFQRPATPSAATTARAVSHALACAAPAACSRTLTSSVGLDTAAAAPPLSAPASTLVPTEAPPTSVGPLPLLLGPLLLGPLLLGPLLLGLLLL